MARPKTKSEHASLTSFTDGSEGVVSARSICNTTYEPLTWLVKNILPIEGVSLLVSPPKIGKSLLILNIAVANTIQSPVLGYFPAPDESRNILYLDLEATKRRSGERMNKMLIGRSMSENLRIATDWPRFDRGGKGKLEDYLGSTDTHVVVIDTLGTIQTQRKISNVHSYAMDQLEIETFRRIAEEYRVSIILIHHTRKSVSNDWVDMVSGSHGLSGSVDTLLYLYRPRMERRALLYVTGRDVDEDVYVLSFSKRIDTWTLLGRLEDEDAQLSYAKSDIVALLNAYDEPMTPREIANILDRSHGYVKKLLVNLVADGHILRYDYGQYVNRLRG